MRVVQVRLLISATDIQDLDELVYMCQMQRGLFWAYSGTIQSGRPSNVRRAWCYTANAGSRRTICVASPQIDSWNPPASRPIASGAGQISTAITAVTTNSIRLITIEATCQNSHSSVLAYSRTPARAPR